MATSTRTKKKPTSAKAWKQQREGVDLDLPSGNVARVKRPGPAVILGGDTLPDSLTPIVSKMVEAAKGKRPKDNDDLTKDPKAINDMLKIVDYVLTVSVVEPKVANAYEDRDGEWALIPDDERDEDTLYTDDVDLMDKMFVFQFAVGGSRDLERFRVEAFGGLGDVPDGEAG